MHKDRMVEISQRSMDRGWKVALKLAKLILPGGNCPIRVLIKFHRFQSDGLFNFYRVFNYRLA